MNGKMPAMIDEWRKSDRYLYNWAKLDEGIATKCNQAKEKWLNAKYDDIEENRTTDSKSVNAKWGKTILRGKNLRSYWLFEIEE